MSTYWQSYEGYVFNGTYPLLTLLQADDETAIFRTEYGEERRPATIHLFHVEPEDSARRLSNWRKAMALSHSSLLHIYEYGDGTFEDTPAIFVVSECAEDNLAAVLGDRALTEAETLEVAEAVSGALAHLHEKGLVHGSLEPAHVFAIENQIKISSDSIAPADALNQPEADIWAFGLLILQCLTQTTPATTDLQPLTSKLPTRFREIVAHSLQPDAGERWTAARIRAALQGDTEQALPLAGDRHLTPISDKPSRARYVAIAAVGIMAAGIGLYVTKPTTDAPDTASRARTEPVPIPAAQPPVIPKPVEKAAEAKQPAARIPAPVRETPPPAVSPQKKGNQFVVVATYNRIEDARKRAKSITSRWPAFQADVHSVRPNQPPYLVIIGANLSKEAARQLQQKARAAGLPRDTYYQSFNP